MWTSASSLSFVIPSVAGGSADLYSLSGMTHNQVFSEASIPCKSNKLWCQINKKCCYTNQAFSRAFHAFADKSNAETGGCDSFLAFKRTVERQGESAE
jgi:hypothetical protein